MYRTFLVLAVVGEIELARPQGVMAQPLLGPRPEGVQPSVLPGDARWTSTPSGEDFANAILDLAPRFHGRARVVLGCTVAPNGRLTGCALLGNPPTEVGLIDAAMRLSRLFRVGLITTSGASTVGRFVNLPLTFIND